MFVRKSSYDTAVSERDRLAVEVARLKAELRVANGEITSLKFRLNDVTFRYDQMLKVGEKKAVPVVEERGVFFVPFTRQPMPGYPKGQTGSAGASTVSKPNIRSISRTIRENDVTVDDIQQISNGLAGFAAAVATVTAVEENSYSYSSASVCRADSNDRYSSSGSSSCSTNDTPTNPDSSYPD